MNATKFMQPYKLSVLQRATLIPFFGIGAILDPKRGDLVAGFGDVTAGLVISSLRKRMENSPSGKKLLKEKPLITEQSLNLPKLRGLPQTTFGKTYCDYMDQHHFSANERSVVKFMSDPDEAYTMARYRQVHDFWHALSGLPPTVLGEVALKCFEFQITGLPVCAIGGLMGQAKLQQGELQLLHSTYIPWALRAGAKCSADLMVVPYEEYLDWELVDVQRELNFEPAPPLRV
jgi:ubiquinone biosynthesis protein COQ4